MSRSLCAKYNSTPLLPHPLTARCYLASSQRRRSKPQALIYQHWDSRAFRQVSQSHEFSSDGKDNGD